MYVLYISFRSDIVFEEYAIGNREVISRVVSKAAQNPNFTDINLHSDKDENITLTAKYAARNQKIVFALKGLAAEIAEDIMSKTALNDLLKNVKGSPIIMQLTESDMTEDDYVVNTSTLPAEMKDYNILKIYRQSEVSSDTTFNKLYLNAQDILKTEGTELSRLAAMSQYELRTGVDADPSDPRFSEPFMPGHIDVKQVKESFDKVKEMSAKLKVPIVTAVQNTDGRVREETSVPARNSGGEIVINQGPVDNVTQKIDLDVSKMETKENSDGTIDVVLSGSPHENEESYDGPGISIEAATAKSKLYTKKRPDVSVEAPSLIPEEYCEDSFREGTEDIDEKDADTGEHKDAQYTNSVIKDNTKSGTAIPDWIAGMIR